MTSKRSKKAPKHLRLATKRWFLGVINDWQLEEHHVRLLTLAGEAWDRAGQAREVVQREGICVKTRLGETRAHPAVAIERDSRLAFARLIRELDLDVVAPAEGKRSPALRSMRTD